MVLAPGVEATDDLDRRLVGSNPYDGFYLTLPSKLTPQQIMNILRSAQGGDVWQLAQAYDLALTQWPMLRKCTNELKEAVSSVKFDVHPFTLDGEEPTESAKEKADFVRRCFHGMNPTPSNDEKDFKSTVYHLADIQFMGVGMQEIIWGPWESGPNGLERRPRATTYVHPRHFTYTQDGFLTVFDENYSRYEFRNDNGYLFRPDANRFLCGQYYSHLGSPLSAGAIRPLLIWLPMIVFGREWSLNFSQKHGAPFMDVTYKPGTPPNEITALNDFVAKAASQGFVVHVEGTTVQVHPPHAQGAENPIRHLMEEADRQCQLLILGQTLTTDLPGKGATGSYAASQTHAGIRGDKIESLAKWVAHCPLNQLARAILRVNYGNDSECPIVSPDFTKPLEAGEKATLISSLGTCPLPMLAEEVYKLLGFAVPEEGDRVVAAGKLGELGPTDDEISALGLPGVEEIDQQLELQEQQAKIAKKYAPAPAKGGKGSSKKPTKASELRAILAEASNEDIEELRALVLKAREATHVNGELKAVEVKITDITKKSRWNTVT